jgi:hypothetical protein
LAGYIPGITSKSEVGGKYIDVYMYEAVRVHPLLQKGGIIACEYSAANQLFMVLT